VLVVFDTVVGLLKRGVDDGIIKMGVVGKDVVERVLLLTVEMLTETVDGNVETVE